MPQRKLVGTCGEHGNYVIAMDVRNRRDVFQKLHQTSLNYSNILTFSHDVKTCDI
ncbi:hypothetical protein MMC20_001273, partial [Loxospora ochrophaea]|nr:hypothetical protein [Loxospora ochrophaea]